MAKLTTKKRNTMPADMFGMPSERKFPMPDKAHAANAKARASQMAKKGKLSAAAKKQIDAKANKMLGEHGPMNGPMDMAPSTRTTKSKRTAKKKAAKK